MIHEVLPSWKFDSRMLAYAIGSILVEVQMLAYGSVPPAVLTEKSIIDYSRAQRDSEQANL